MEEARTELTGRNSAAISNPYLSIVIRARNEAEGLHRVFEALRAQRCDFAWETIVVDNESEDETTELCARYGARVIKISRDEFTYGRALNRGIAAACGELVLLLSAHSLPVGSRFLEAAVAPFADPQIGAARCLNAHDLEQMAAWYRARDISYPSLEEQREAEIGSEWTRLYPAATCCVLRRVLWERIKFDEEIEANEDKLWASQVLRHGFVIRCCAEAVYFYTRHRSQRAARMRDLREHLALYRLTGQPPLGRARFALRVIKAMFLAPLVAARYLYEQVSWNFALLSIPHKARRSPRSGSVPEFDARQAVR
jgi:rhamnosyltransferase